MCLMCAHTVFFLHDTEEGPRSLCFKPFVKKTSTRGENLISSQNGTKFWRKKQGVGSSLKSTRYQGYVSKRLFLNKDAKLHLGSECARSIFNSEMVPKINTPKFERPVKCSTLLRSCKRVKMTANLQNEILSNTYLFVQVNTNP